VISRSQMGSQMTGDRMPIRKVKGGYKWGSKGKVYKDRRGAERQAAAAYASGYKEPKKMRSGGANFKNPSDLQELADMIGVVKKGAGGINVAQALGNIDFGGKKMSSGGKVSSRGDGVAKRGRTRGRLC